MMSFESWLKKQKNRDDPIGDLAKDFINTQINSIEKSFRKYNPSSVAWETYCEARKEYVLELANDLYVELDKVIDREKYEPTIWHNSLEIIYDLKDKLADMDSFLSIGLEEE